MTKISRRPLSQEQLHTIEIEFWKTVVLLKTPREAQIFFHDLLTHTERQMLAKRLQIARMLIEGYDYQRIAKKLNVTAATIAKVSNWLHTFGEGYRLAVKRLLSYRTDS
jgi:TrpR-related protein YerC/YecD